jgi:hypothetical protein
VGRSYPPEFYSWIKTRHVRKLFEKIAIETEEDYQNIIKKLQEFGVEVWRPNLLENPFVDGKYVSPPMTPRDYTVMVGDVFYENYSFNFRHWYNNVKDPEWPRILTVEEFYQTAPQRIIDECEQQHRLREQLTGQTCYNEIIDKIKARGNIVKSSVRPFLNGAMLARIGKDLFLGTPEAGPGQEFYKNVRGIFKTEFPNHRCHVVETGGHSDGTYCPVTPGLIISLYDVPTYEKTYPGWQVIYLPNQSWSRVMPFLRLKQKNQGKWWIPGFEDDLDVIQLVETWLSHWTGYVEETVFDVNMLIIDPKNVMVFNYNKTVFNALERYGITPHVVPFRHRYFWDGGIHCVTSDISRRGTQQDYFPNRI